MAFRFIHTADWQVGKPFANIPGDAGVELRLQRIRTVNRIAETAREKSVDAVLVAGDAFDSNEVSDRTIVRTIEALQPYLGTWIFLPGNHDAALAHSVWTRMREMGLPTNVIIADQPELIGLGNGSVAVLPAPLRRRREALDQTEWFDAAVTPEGCIRIGLAHGTVAGRLPGTAEAANEIPEDRAARAGLDYLALGDWHGALRIAPRTWYSGSPEPDRHKANESGCVQLVEIAGPGASENVETLAIGHYHWIRRSVELVDGTCDAAIAALNSIAAEHRRCVVAFELAGAITFAERVRLERELKVWDSRFHYLDIDDSGLVDEPTADDLDAIDTAGFVRLAVERLREQASDPTDAEAETARTALRMLYLDHVAADT